MQFQVDRMYRTADAVAGVCDILAKENVIGFWKSFILFLTDLQEKCTNDVFKILNAAISIRLLRRFLAPNVFSDSEELKAIELLCLKFGSVLAETMANESHTKTTKCASAHTEYRKCVDEFLDLLAGNLSLFTDPFHQYTLNILHQSTRYVDSVTETKYLQLVSYVLDSSTEASGKIYEHCNEHRRMR